MPILNFGSLNIDYVYRVPHFAKLGETISFLSCQRHIDGKGLNQSIALARAGLKPFHAGAISCDGDFLLETLRVQGVDTGYVRLLENTPYGQAIMVGTRLRRYSLYSLLFTWFHQYMSYV